MRRFGCVVVALMLGLGARLLGKDTGEQLLRFELDFGRSPGVIRPLHGVNSGPLCYRGTVDLTEYHRELGIPLTRLHDVPWVNAEAVDVHLVFPEFRNDPALPESYRFEPTDDYIQAITNVGSRIVYRLGESIEHTPRQYFVHPPADPQKWAAICAGIIRHYNEGWANGFRHGISYWEIWNEPDVRPAMWTGTDAEFFRLYEVTAEAIRSRFPSLKVGGPAVGGTGRFVEDRFQPAPFLTSFLAFCRERAVPLDFFSWHQYTSNPWDLPARARAVRQLLDEHGFGQTESHLNEWNYLPDDDWGPLTKRGQGERRQRWAARMAGLEGAAFAAAALILLQDAPVDAANFYTGEVQGFGLFDYSGAPKSTYYAFKAFRQMLQTPRRVEARAAIAGEVAILAGTDFDQTRVGVLISNFKHANSAFELEWRALPWNGPTAYGVSQVEATPSLADTDRGTIGPEVRSLRLRLAAPGVALIQLKPGKALP